MSQQEDRPDGMVEVTITKNLPAWTVWVGCDERWLVAIRKKTKGAAEKWTRANEPEYHDQRYIIRHTLDGPPSSRRSK